MAAVWWVVLVGVRQGVDGRRRVVVDGVARTLVGFTAGEVDAATL